MGPYWSPGGIPFTPPSNIVWGSNWARRDMLGTHYTSSLLYLVLGLEAVAGRSYPTYLK